MPSPVQPMMLMTSLQLDAPLSIQVMATSPTASAASSSSTRTVYVRMRNVSGSVAIELSPAITSVHELIQHFHERVFSKSYVSLLMCALCIALLILLLFVVSLVAQATCKQTTMQYLRVLLCAFLL